MHNILINSPEGLKVFIELYQIALSDIACGWTDWEVRLAKSRRLA